MSEFALLFRQNKDNPEVDRLITQVEHGSETEVRQALAQLVDLAQRSNDLDDWNTVGLGFHYAGMKDQATHVFSRLVQEAPGNDAYRLNLAVSYAQTEQSDLCRHELRHLAEHATTAEYREVGREQLAGYERFLGLTEEDEKLRALQTASLRLVIKSAQRTPDAFVRLGRLLLLRSRLEPDGDWLTQAREVLEEGRAAFPRVQAILEHLVLEYFRSDPDDRLRDTLEQLQSIDPNSHVFQVLSQQNPEEAEAFSRGVDERAQGLMRETFDSGDDRVRQAALHDLAKIVAMYPQNHDYRMAYAFALISLQRREAALTEARRLTEVPSQSHGFHFNLGQIFWLGGDAAHGRRHLELALQYANDPHEQQDVHDRIADLER